MSYGIFGGIGLVAGGVAGGVMGFVPGYFAESSAHSSAKDDVIALQQESYEAEASLHTVELRNGNRLSVQIGERCLAIITSFDASEPSDQLAQIIDADTEQVCGTKASEVSTKISLFNDITDQTKQAQTNLNQIHDKLQDAKHDTEEPIAQNYALFGAVAGALALGAVGLMAARALDN